MTIKRRDFQKVAALIHEFLLKLGEDYECAELRDTLNLALLHMQRYYRKLRRRMQQEAPVDGAMLGRGIRGMSPMTPFRDAPDHFQWKWVNLDRPSKSSTLPVDVRNSIVKLSPIFGACIDNNTLLISNMISKDAHCVEEQDGMGRTPLMYAINFGKLDVVQLLLESGANTNVPTYDGSTAVHRACHDGFVEALQYLINYDGDLTVQDTRGRAPLHWACTTKDTKCLKMLLEYRLDISVGDNDGMTPSMWACRLDHIDHYALLSDRLNSETGSDSEEYERDCNGRTWFHWSVRRTEPLECLKTILTPETARLEDNEGKTPMHIAAEIGALASVREIWKICNEDLSILEARDQNNRTPLILAAINGHGEVVNQLLTNGADFRCEDDTGATAWHYATKRQLHYCLLIIASYVRKYNKDNGLSGSESDQPSNGITNGYMVDQKLKLNNHSGDQESYTPTAPKHPPFHPRTPRTPRASKSVNSGISGNNTMPASVQSPPTPRSRQYGKAKHNEVPERPRNFAVTPRTANSNQGAHNVSKKSSNPIYNKEANHEYPQRSTGSAGKRKRERYDTSERDRMSVMSVDSAEVPVDVKPTAHLNHSHNQEYNGNNSDGLEQQSVSIDDMQVSDVDSDVVQEAESDEEMTPATSPIRRHSHQNTYNHSQVKSRHAQSKPMPIQRGHRSHEPIKYPSPPGHVEGPYYHPQGNVDLDDRSTHSQYHGGLSSSHVYDAEDYEASNMQTGRTGNDHGSPSPHMATDGRSIPPAHLEPLSSGKKKKANKKKKKMSGSQPWGENVAAIPPPNNYGNQYSPPQTAQAHGGVPSNTNYYPRPNSGQRGVSPQPALHKATTKKKGYAQPLNRHGEYENPAPRSHGTDNSVSTGSAPPPLPQAQPRPHLQRTPAEQDLSSFNNLTDIDNQEDITSNKVKSNAHPKTNKSRFPNQMTNGPLPSKNMDYGQQGSNPLKASSSALTTMSPGSGTPRQSRPQKASISPSLSFQSPAMPSLGRRKNSPSPSIGSGKNLIPPISDVHKKLPSTPR